MIKDGNMNKLPGYSWVDIRNKTHVFGVSTKNNDSPWWLLVDVGDGERAWDAGNGFGRRKEK